MKRVKKRNTIVTNNWIIPKRFLVFYLFIMFILLIQFAHISLFKVVNGNNLREIAANRTTVTKNLIAARGTIYDNDGNILATNVASYTLIAYLSETRTDNPDNPRHVVDKEKTAKLLSEKLDAPYDYIYDRLTDKGRYQVEFGKYGSKLTELEKIDYRCKKELTGAIRIVTIGSVDDCACCAPHVRNTGEVGIFKVMEVSSYKGGVRLSILCGFRALLDYRIVRSHLREISHITSAPMYETAEAVQRLKDERDAARQKAGEANRRMLSIQISALREDALSPMLFTEGVDTSSIRNAVNEMTKSHDGYCGIFNGNDKEGYSFIIGSRDLDCNDLAAFMREKFEAKCGGKAEMIQGHIDASRATIQKFIVVSHC